MNNIKLKLLDGAELELTKSEYLNIKNIEARIQKEKEDAGKIITSSNIYYECTQHAITEFLNEKD